MGLRYLGLFGLVCSLGFFVLLVLGRRLRLGLGWRRIGLWLNRLKWGVKSWLARERI